MNAFNFRYLIAIDLHTENELVHPLKGNLLRRPQIISRKKIQVWKFSGLKFVQSTRGPDFW